MYRVFLILLVIVFSEPKYCYAWRGNYRHSSGTEDLIWIGVFVGVLLLMWISNLLKQDKNDDVNSERRDFNRNSASNREKPRHEKKSLPPPETPSLSMKTCIYHGVKLSLIGSENFTDVGREKAKRISDQKIRKGICLKETHLIFDKDGYLSSKSVVKFE